MSLLIDWWKKWVCGQMSWPTCHKNFWTLFAAFQGLQHSILRRWLVQTAWLTDLMHEWPPLCKILCCKLWKPDHIHWTPVWWEIVNKVLNIYAKYYTDSTNTCRVLTNYLNFVKCQPLLPYISPIVRHEFARQSITFRITSFLNNIEQDIKDKIYSHCTLVTYKSYIKKKMIQSYKSQCTIVDCPLCSCNKSTVSNKTWK